MQGDAAWTKDAAGLPENPDQDRAGNVFKDGVGELHVNACGREAGSRGAATGGHTSADQLESYGQNPSRDPASDSDSGQMLRSRRLPRDRTRSQNPAAN